MSKIKYVAFLRGINVGGKSLVKMSDLKLLLEKLGATDVKTLLNSGNVVFEVNESPEDFKQKVEQTLYDKYSRKIDVLIRSFTDIEALVNTNPFGKIKLTNDIRFYVTLLPDGVESKLELPYVSEDGSFTIIEISNGAAISVLTLSKMMGTTDAMKILEREFGKSITTRNWNTIMRLSKV
ncbi:MAG TPA: DUF1697 domain-containing protein [Patescibacteria group bacterium]|nr:DUF1697 domain-containing protein [Patescibacteria group bacterium]